jgi:hypothetical protein
VDSTSTSARISDLIENELSSISDARVIHNIRSLLVTPEPLVRKWDYGADGDAYPCWSVLNHVESNSGIAYCESGFGPEAPWGLVALSGSSMSMGMDSDWFYRFLDAYFGSAPATTLPIWRVYQQQQGSEYPGAPITEEGEWNATWKEVERLQSAHPGQRYNCSQSIFDRGTSNASIEMKARK